MLRIRLAWILKIAGFLHIEKYMPDTHIQDSFTFIKIVKKSQPYKTVEKVYIEIQIKNLICTLLVPSVLWEYQKG